MDVLPCTLDGGLPHHVHLLVAPPHLGESTRLVQALKKI
jgi:hypothetical protein